jgi:hypothetical protein
MFRLRVGALLLGCALLFWQYDGALVDWFFGAGILAAILLWSRGIRTLDVAWPQVLILAFLGLTGLATLVAGGTLSAFLITAYLIALSLAFAAVLREDLTRIRVVEAGLVVSGCIAALLICLGYASRQLGWQPLEVLSYDAFRGQGLFKDPNVAGGFVACAYPFAAARSSRVRFGTAFLFAATAVFGAGVIFSFSREALLLFALAVVGVIASFAVLRQPRQSLALVLACIVAVVSFGALDRLPAYRGYQLELYDQNGRFVAWRFGIDMLREAPFGTGSGSFERRSQARFDAAVALNALPAPVDTTNGAPPPEVDQASGFHSEIAAQPTTLQLGAGAISEPVTFAFRNTGTRTWTRGVQGQEARLGIGEAGLVLEAGTSPVIARFAHIDDQSDGSLGIGWLGPDRVVVQTEAEVAPGAEGSFTFQIRAPRQGGTYKLHLRPVIEGVTWMEEQGVALEMTVTSTATGLGSYTSSAARAAGGEVIGPTPPSAYTRPAAALKVSTSTQLITALADSASRDIVLANGTYDNPEPFYNPYGHRLYAATLGGAVLRAGLSLGANDGPGGGLVQGVTFDVSDPAKTLSNSVVNVWGGGAGAQVLDVTINGHSAIGSGILAQPLEYLLVQRVMIRDVTDYGVVAPGGTAVSSLILLEDLNIAGVTHPQPGSSDGKAEACIWLANAATVRHAMVRSCGFAGVWTGAGNAGSLLEHLDIDGTPVGIYVNETASQLSVRRIHTGSFVSTGIWAAGLGARQPGRSSSPGDLVVVPSAHNTYLRVAAESGALGFIAFGAYLILTFWALWTGRWRNNWALHLGTALVLVAGLGIDTLHWRQLWLYLGMAAAISVRNPTPFRLPGLSVRPMTSGPLGVWAHRLHEVTLTGGPRRALRPDASAEGPVPTRGMDTFEIRAELLRRDAAKVRHSAPDVVDRLGHLEIVLRTRAISAARALEAAWALSLMRMRDGWARPAFTAPPIDGIGRELRSVAVQIVAFLVVATRSVGLGTMRASRTSHDWLLPRALGAFRALRRVSGVIERFWRTAREFAAERAQIQHAPPEAGPLAATAEAEPVDEDLVRAESRLAAKQNTLGYYHPDVAAELHLIGAIHHDAGRYTEAVAFYGASLAIRERVLEPTHPEVASVLEDLAVARRDQGEASEAESLTARAKQIRRAREIAAASTASARET